MIDLTKWYGNQDPKRDYRDPRRIYTDLRFLGAEADEASAVVREVLRLRGGRSRTEVLTVRYKELLAAAYHDVTNLSKEGPQGSKNAYRAGGWVKSPNGSISRAAKAASPLLWAEGWAGGGPTPEVLIPECIAPQMEALWREIFC